MTTYTNVEKNDVKPLLGFGYSVERTKSKYEVIRLRSSGVFMVLFTTNKLLVQGNEDSVKAAENLLHELRIGKKVVPIKFVKEQGEVIGSDEALKGDSFGGIVVAAVKANDGQRQDLLFAGVMDSKKLKDYEIRVIAERIKKVAKYKVISLLPYEYNKYDNVTKLLNELHFKAIKELKPANLIVVDKYPGCNVHGKQETKAEQKYVEVAAASILARDAALKQLQKISKRVGFQVPKGSSQVSDALERVAKTGFDLSKIAKIGFKNVRKYLF